MGNEELIQQKEDPKFAEMKTILQSILDKHLPPEKRLSVETFDKEDVFYLCTLLLEKDNEKRNHIRDKIKKIQNYKMQEFQIALAEIEREKTKIDNYQITSDELNFLADNISAENEMEVMLDYC